MASRPPAPAWATARWRARERAALRRPRRRWRAACGPAHRTARRESPECGAPSRPRGAWPAAACWSPRSPRPARDRRSSARRARRACHPGARCSSRTRHPRCRAAGPRRCCWTDRARAPTTAPGAPAAAHRAAAPHARHRAWPPRALRSVRPGASRSRAPRRRWDRWRARPSTRGERDAAARRARARGRGGGWVRAGPRATPPAATAPWRSRPVPTPRRAWPRISSQVLLVEDVEVPGELLERHLRVDLAAVDLQRPHERRVALATHGEGGGVALLAHASEQVVIGAAVRVGEKLHPASQLPLEQTRRLRELGLHAMRVLRLGLTGGPAQIAVSLAVGLHVEALGDEALELVPGQRVAATADVVGVDEQRGREPELLEDRIRVIAERVITVVEGQDDGLLRELALQACPVHELGQRHDAIALALKVAHLLGERVGAEHEPAFRLRAEVVIDEDRHELVAVGLD